TSVAINGAINQGYSSGDAIRVIQEVADEVLPTGYGYEFSGMTREEMTSSGQTLYIFLLCLIFVYFLLAGQYESYLLPLAVILSLPVGMAGTFIFVKLFAISHNISVKKKMCKVSGVLAENAILFVE